MKPYSIFIEDLQADKEEFDALADVDMGNNKINRRVTDLEIAHGMALTTVSFEFECFMDVNYFLSNKDNNGIIQKLIEQDILLDLDDKNLFTYDHLQYILDTGFGYVTSRWTDKFDELIKLDYSPTIEDRMDYLLDNYNTLYDIVELFDILTDNIRFKLITNTHLILNNKSRIKLNYITIENQISKVFNTNKTMIYYKHDSGNNEFKIAHPDYWFIEPDSSIKNGPDTHIPVEIISPWIPAKDAIKFVTKFRNEVGKQFNIKTNDTTSMHCSFRTHISDRDKKVPLMLDVLKLLALLDEDEHLERFNRSNNHFTKPIQNALKEFDKGDLDNIKYKLEQSLKHNDKYSSINFNDFLTDYNVKTGNGRMEIRIIGDDYMGSLFSEAMRSLNEFILLISSALDNDLHDKEYKDNLNNKLRSPINEIETICDDYSFNYNKFNQLISVTDTFEDLCHLLNALDDFSSLFKIHKVLIETFNIISNYIDVIKSFTKFITKYKSRTVNPLFKEFINELMHGSRYNLLSNAIKRNKEYQEIYDLYECLLKWLDEGRIEIEDLNIVLDVLSKHEDKKDICKEVIDYMYFNKYKRFFQEILYDRQTNKKHQTIFEYIFSDIL